MSGLSCSRVTGARPTKTARVPQHAPTAPSQDARRPRIRGTVRAPGGPHVFQPAQIADAPPLQLGCE